MKKSWMIPMLTKLTQLPKEDCRSTVLIEFTQLTWEVFFRVSIHWVGSTNEEFSYVDLSIWLVLADCEDNFEMYKVVIDLTWPCKWYK